MTLGSGDLQLAVEVPHGEDFYEWLAINTIEFYNEGMLMMLSQRLVWNSDR